MKELRRFCSAVLALSVLAAPALAADGPNIPHPKTYLPTLAQIREHKAAFDDPRPYLKDFGPKQVLPKALYEFLSYDVEAMKTQWAELVGFRAPDVVGKIAPEIKPGKYTWQDKEKHPGLKALMWPDLYARIKAGGPPHAGSIPEFEVVPTRQYYYALPVAKATRENRGKAQLDASGYLKPDTWVAGYPFPKPEGPFTAQQVMYNLEKRYLAWGLDFYILSPVLGYTKDLTLDFDGLYDVTHQRLAGRVLAPPYGWYDDRARERGEFKNFILGFLAPRDVYGAAQSALYYLDPGSPDQLMMYLPSLRRVRKMSATDSQDPVMGQDQIYDDNEGWMQKLSSTRYPYKFEVLEDREYLVPAPTQDGAEYIASKGVEFRNMKFERRPVYVIKLTQQDPNYVYSYRIFYVDKETFNYLHIENYDQKGRLYRTWDGNYSFFPEMGAFSWSGALILMRDHIDTHSGCFQAYQLPAFWTREDVSLQGVMRKAK
ncbi:MAG: DUF1329 domain-containing protein [Deferrisomatales bacterium]